MVQTKNIISQNPWWKYDAFQDFDKDLSELYGWPFRFTRRELPLNPGEIYLLRGPRQVGKTTLIKQQIAELIRKKVDPVSILYYPCDYLHSTRELRGIIDFHSERNRGTENLFIFLDEITYLQDWNREIKAQVDAGLLRKATLVLTGSGAAQLKRKAEQLPGRGLEGNQYLLLPLTFREFMLQASDDVSHRIGPDLWRAVEAARKRLESNSMTLDEDMRKQRDSVEALMPFGPDLDTLLRIYLLTGGFPKTINALLRNNLESIEEETYTTFVKMVLGDFSKQGKEETLARQILEGVIRRQGTRFGYRTLTEDVDATHPTVIQYLETMNDSLLTQTVHSIDFKRETARYKADKKIYVTDPFIYHSVNAFIKGMDGYTLSRETLDEESSIFSLVESVVASHLTQARVVPYMAEPMSFLYFFYNPRKEVDFVYKRKSGKFTGIEVKYGKRERKVRFPEVSQFKERITLTRDTVGFGENEAEIPAGIFLSLLDKSPSCL